MGFLSSMNISASGMTAERRRLDTIAENISNINTTRTEGGGPYRRKVVVFEQRQGASFRNVLRDKMGMGKEDPGVKVSRILEDPSPLKTVYDPEHPDADEFGYIELPNIDLVKEITDSMSATRAYEANVTVFNAVKLMASKALEIGR